MRRLTTTSYAVLGLLCLRPWTAYELTQQLERGWRLTWPRARSGVYEEPKRLVAHGFATAETGRRGLRGTRTTYAVTPAGRAAMRAWLGEPSAEPRFESEAMVRLVFADLGTKEQLRVTLAGLREQAAGMREQLLAQAAGYLDDGGPFPERLHLIALAGDFLHEYVALLERWSSAAEAEVAGWPNVRRGGDDGAVRRQIEASLAVHDR